MSRGPPTSEITYAKEPLRKYGHNDEDDDDPALDLGHAFSFRHEPALEERLVLAY